MGADSPVVVDELASHIAGKRLDILVFTAPNRGPLRRTNLQVADLRPAAESVGLARITPHDLRRTADGLAMAAATNVEAVQRMLGRDSTSTTLDVHAQFRAAHGFSSTLRLLAGLGGDSERSAPAVVLCSKVRGLNGVYTRSTQGLESSGDVAELSPLSVLR